MMPCLGSPDPSNLGNAIDYYLAYRHLRVVNVSLDALNLANNGSSPMLEAAIKKAVPSANIIIGAGNHNEVHTSRGWLAGLDNVISQEHISWNVPDGSMPSPHVWVGDIIRSSPESP